MRDESSASNVNVAAITSQQKVTQQILRHWQSFRDLKNRFAGSRRAEQLSLRSQQRIVATVEESVLRTEMAGLEFQEEDAPKRILFFKPMSWLGQFRPHHRDKPGLLVSGRLFLLPPWAPRSQRDQIADLSRTTHENATGG